MRTRFRFLVLATAVAMLLVACEAEVTLEPAPDAIVAAAETCPQRDGWTKVDSNTESASGPWGTATPISNGIEVHVNAGFSVEFCVKGGPGYSLYTVEGEADATLLTPMNPNNNQNYGLSHYAYRPSGSATTTTTTTDGVNTTGADPEPTTTGAGDTTTTAVDGQTTTTSSAAASTLIPSGDTTTTVDGQTTTTAGAGGDTTDLGQDTTTTIEGGTTTTADVGGDTTDLGQDTTTTIESQTTAAGDTTTTTSDEVDDTLAYTGPEGPFGTGYLVILAVVLVLLGVGLLRRRTE